MLEMRLSYKYTLPTEGNQLSVYREGSSGGFRFVLEKQSETFPIEEYLSPIPLENLKKEEEEGFFQCHRPKVSELSNRSFKVRLLGKLLGGAPPQHNIVQIIRENRHVTNTRLSELLKGNLPPGTYSSVYVSDTTYTFGARANVPAKEFVLQVCDSGSLQGVLLGLRAFFVGLPTDPMVNGNALQNYLLGTDTDDWEATEQVIRTLAGQERKIYIYVSQDLERFYCFPQVANGICTLL